MNLPPEDCFSSKPNKNQLTFITTATVSRHSLVNMFCFGTKQSSLSPQVTCGRGANVAKGQFRNTAFANTPAKNEADTNLEDNTRSATMIQLPKNNPPEVTAVTPLYGYLL